MSIKDLTGLRYGYLVVMKYVGRTSHRISLYECRCDCGNVTITRSDNLKRGEARSCGCLFKNYSHTAHFLDLTGQVFGRLSVIEYKGTNKNRQATWLCKCVCGKEIVISSNCLRTGDTKSCGCSKITHGLSRTSAYRDIRRIVSEVLNTRWTRKMEKELRKFQPVCVVCGSNKEMSTDHVLPLSKGYGLRPGNAVRLCKSCNSKKQNRKPHTLDKEFRKRLLIASLEFKKHWNKHV